MEIYKQWSRIVRGGLLFALTLLLQSGCGGASPAAIQFGATPSVIEYGNSSTLSWQVTAAAGRSVQGVSIEPGIGIVDPSGSMEVSPNQTTDYKLVALVVDGSGNQTQHEKKVTLLVQQGSAWNWQRNDVFKDFNNIQLLSPWAADQHFGLDVTGYTHPPEDGWRLYIKRLTCADYIEGCDNRDLPQYEDRRNFPYFALYNLHTGVMRIFVYINKPNFTGSKQLLVTSSLLQDGSLSDFGLSLQETDFSLPLAEKDEQQNVQVSIVPSFVNKWAVLERTFSYDPSVPPNNLSLNLFFEERQIQDVKLSGTFNFSLTSQQKAGGKDIMSAIMKAPSTVKKHTKDVVNAGNEIKDVAEDLGGSEDIPLPGSLVDRIDSFGDFVINNAGTFGAIAGFVGGLDFISSISNMFGKSSSVQFGSGSITLDGTIVNQFPQNQISISLHNSYQNGDVLSQASMMQEAEAPALGLFSLRETPKMWVRPRCGSNFVSSLDFACSYYTATVRDPSNPEANLRRLTYQTMYLDWQFETDFARLVVLNPDSDMVLKKIAIEPAVFAPYMTWTEVVEYQNPWEDLPRTEIKRLSRHWTDDSQDFIPIDVAPQLAGLSKDGTDAFFGNKFMTSENAPSLGLAMSKNSLGPIEYDDIKPTDRTGLNCDCQNVSGNYKVYLLFVHKDEVNSENPKMFAEYIHTYRADVVLGQRPN